ncbi:hypothetical protein JVU11DRAFT_9329 [Chiua virens]|nr:hypothetical protein JVU11DRAFT_9329 [Chiua virens]
MSELELLLGQLMRSDNELEDSTRQKRYRKVIESDSELSDFSQQSRKHNRRSRSKSKSDMKSSRSSQKNRKASKRERKRAREEDNHSSSSGTEDDDDGSDDDYEDYLAGARAVTRSNDMFCDAETVIKVILYLMDEDSSDCDENKEDDARRKTYLAKIGEKTIKRHKRSYQILTHFAPALKGLVRDASKKKELRNVLKKINKTIKATRADDAARLKDKIGSYVAPDPTSKEMSETLFRQPILATQGRSSTHKFPTNDPVEDRK